MIFKKKFDIDDDQPEASQGQGPEGKMGTGQVVDELSEEATPERTEKRTKLFAVLFVAVIVLVFAVGGFMGYRFSKRFDELNRCVYEYIQGDYAKPEFKPCVRKVLQTTSFDDVKKKAIDYLVMTEDEDAIPLLVRLLDSGGEVMRKAAKAISAIDGPKAQAARQPLVRILEKTEGKRDKVILAWALASLGDERAFRPLLDGYIEGYTRELSGWRDEFLVDFAARDPKAFDEMIALSRSKDDAHRWFAATTLGKIKSPRVIPVLLKLVEDSNSNVVRAAAISLGMTGAKEAGPAILRVLQRYPEMKDELLRSIEQSAGAVGLAEVYKHARSPSLKSKIVSYIRDIKDPRSGDILVEILKDIEKETAGKGVKAGLKTKKEIALALSDIGDPRAIPLLKKLIYLDNIEAVCKLYDCGPVSNFENLTQDQKDAYLRGYRLSPAMSEYIKGLVNIGNDEAKRILLELWNKIEELNRRYRADAYLYWPCRPAEVMYAMGRLKIEGIGRLLEDEVCSNASANQRAIALNVGTRKDLTIPCPDIGAAAKALGRAGYKPILEKLIKIAKRPKDIDFSVPNVDYENIYSDRREVLRGMAFLGDPGGIETIETIIEDPTDYRPTRDAAAEALPYVITPDRQAEIIEKIKDESMDVWARSWYVRSVIPRATEAIAQPLFEILKAEPPNPLLTPLGAAIGESCNREVIARVFEFVKSAQSPSSLSDAQSAGLLAVVLCGDDSTLREAIRYLKAGDNEDRVRMSYTVIPFYLTNEAFVNDRVYKKLQSAYFLKTRDILWPWQYLSDRMSAGYEDNPDGLSVLEIRRGFYEMAKKGGWKGEIAIRALLGMKSRGYVLALTREGGDVSATAWDILRGWE